MLSPEQHIHIVGIGGFGMSAIARVLLQMGYPVSGSDLRANAFTQELTALGAAIYQGHAAAQIGGADVVLATSAATDANPEIAAARAAGVPVLRRRDILGELMAQKMGVAVAGTHGKTTTTAMMVHALITAGRDPSYIVGGVMLDTGTNAYAGQGAYFVIEADEYDRMFLGLTPQIAIVTNVEHDHVDCFPTPGDVTAAFEQFVARLPDDGLLIVCADDRGSRALGEARRAAGKPVVFYGLGDAVRALGPATGWSADQIVPDAAGGLRHTVRRGDTRLFDAHLRPDGEHNLLNALAVYAAAHHLGVPLGKVAEALATFRGTGRRAETMGQAGGVTVISDYAHHPTEIRATLAALGKRHGVRHLWAVWQPHTYGRLRQFADRFTEALAHSGADHVLVTDVYSVREKVTPGLDAVGMAGRIADSTGVQVLPRVDVRYTGALKDTAQVLAAEVQPGDIVVLLSAGDAPQVGTLLLEHLRTREEANDS